MARVELSGPIASMRGTLSKESGLCFRVINGKTYAFRKPGWQGEELHGLRRPVPRPATKKQMSQQEVFKQSQEMTKAVMGCAGLRRVYEAQWKRQKKYVTLRGYVSAEMIRTLKGEK